MLHPATPHPFSSFERTGLERRATGIGFDAARTAFGAAGHVIDVTVVRLAIRPRFSVLFFSSGFGFRFVPRS